MESMRTLSAKTSSGPRGATARWSWMLVAVLAFLVLLAGAASGIARADDIHANANDPVKGQEFASDPVAAVEAARKAVADGNIEQAIKSLARYVAGHPREIEPARYLGDLEYRQADLGGAERVYLAILKISPADRETHDRLGGIYAAQDRVADAIEHFKRSLPSTTAYRHLVELHRRRGDLPAYEQEIKRDADAAPSDPWRQFALGQVYHAERRFDVALEVLVRAVALARRCETLTELGSVYLDVRQTARAIESFQRCLDTRSDYYPALVNLGDAYLEIGQTQKATSLFDRATKVSADRPEAWVNLGYVEDLAGRWQPAVQLYLRALTLDPLNRDAYVNLGYDYNERRLYALAEAAIIKGLSFSPNDGRLHYLLGRSYADQGKRALARTEFERAATSDEPDIARAASRDLARLAAT